MATDDSPGLKVVELKQAERVVNQRLIDFLETQLEHAKKGETILFSATVLWNHPVEAWHRAIYKGQKASWHDHLAFTEIMTREVERMRDFVDDIFEE